MRIKFSLRIHTQQDYNLIFASIATILNIQIFKIYAFLNRLESKKFFMSLEDMHISQKLHTSNTTKKVLLD